MITITEEEKKAIREKLLSDSAELQYGIDSRNPALVGHSATDTIFMDHQVHVINFLCRECPFFDACTRARKDSGEIDRNQEMLLGFDHDISCKPNKS